MPLYFYFILIHNSFVIFFCISSPENRPEYIPCPKCCILWMTAPGVEAWGDDDIL